MSAAEMDGVQLDLDRMCRACKNYSPTMHRITDVLENESENPRIDEMLMACTSVQIKDGDGLPTLICEECLVKLKDSFSFKLQCESVDLALRTYAEEVKRSEETIKTNLINELQEMIEYKPKVDKSDTQLENSEEVVSKHDFIDILDNQLILTCRQCYKVFSSLDGLKCHKRVHSGSLLKCKFCDKQYTRLGHLQRHQATHERRKVHVCKICNKTLTRFEHLKRHLVTHLKEKPFSCHKCNRGFCRAEHLGNHETRCKGDRIHICDICNKGFIRADSLEVHRHLHENKMPVLPTLENLDNIQEHYIEIDYDESVNTTLDEEDEDDELEDPDYFEPQVHITENESNVDKKEEEESFDDDNSKHGSDAFLTFDFEEVVQESVQDENVQENYEDNHLDSDDSDYSPTKLLRVKRGRGRPRKHPIGHKGKGKGKGKRGRPSLKRKLDLKNLLREDEPYSCSVCKEEFENLSSLERHAPTHEGAKAFECKTCGQTFFRVNHLKRHMYLHSEVKPYSCNLCLKRFYRKDHLTQHMKFHNGPYDFECDKCNRQFSRADHLAKHKYAKHNEGERVVAEKKYKCEVCMKGFTTAKYRDVHMKGHTGEKMHQCKICEKTFLSKSHLTEHMKFHNDNSKKFLCSECGQRFIRNDYLIIHMRRHRGEKPFKCKFCGKGFPRTTDLTVHERYHTGEKTHLCVVCGRGFGRAYNLTVHMRTHTGEKPYQCTYCDAAFAQGNDLKAHVRRHTGERFQCELCTETFLMGYLLTQHKRTIHGLNVVSNIRRLQPSHMINPDDPPPITITLPAPVVPPALQNQMKSEYAFTHFPNE